MSHHVLHVMTPGAVLRKERGRLVCQTPEGPERSLPFADLRAVIIAARGVTLSSNVLSALLAGDAVVLHCDEKYRPAGLTVGCQRIVDAGVFAGQHRPPARLPASLWRLVLSGKIANQAAVLRQVQAPAAKLERAAADPRPDEAAAARHYWRALFAALGAAGARRRSPEDTACNGMLNYGYAVLGALVHRGIIVHGLNPLLGLHHTPRYRSHPLVYDLMEPLRPFVDLMLVRFAAAHPALEAAETMPAWCRQVAGELAGQRLERLGCRIKLLDAIDSYAASVAAAFRECAAKALWVPEL